MSSPTTSGSATIGCTSWGRIRGALGAGGAGAPAVASRAVNLRGRRLEWGSRTYVMAILNLTPDSFSGDGLARDVDRAVERARGAIENGADILDVGGESTRPGARPVSADEELARVLPVIAAVRSQFDIPISVDTYKAAVAEAALDAGADMVNDVWALRADHAMVGLVARRGVPLVLMHNRSNPSNVALADRLGAHYVGTDYEDLLTDVKRELAESIALAHAAGVTDDQIILDPGIGFGKTVAQNLTLLNRVDEIRAMGYPVLVGPSRKSFIGLTLDLPPEERVEGTAAAVAVAIARGVDIARVHDVREMVRVTRMADAVVRPAMR